MYLSSEILIINETTLLMLSKELYVCNSYKYVLRICIYNDYNRKYIFTIITSNKIIYLY